MRNQLICLFLCLAFTLPQSGPAHAINGCEKNYAQLTQSELKSMREGGDEVRLAMASKVLNGKKLSEMQGKAILKAHAIGVPPYSKADLLRKARKLKAAGFAEAEIRALMENEVTGFWFAAAALYGAVSFTRDVFNFFSHSRASIHSTFNGQLKAAQKEIPGAIERPYTIFNRVFDNYQPSSLANDKLAIDASLADYLKFPKNRRSYESLDDTLRKGASRLSSFRYAESHGEEVAMLVHNPDGSQQLLVGKISPLTKKIDVSNVPDSLREKFGIQGKSMEVLSGIKITTEEGERELGINDILVYTHTDLRDRSAIFKKVFEKFHPKQGVNDERVLTPIIADLKKWNNETIQGDLTDGLRGAVERVAGLKNAEASGKAVGVLARNPDGSHELIVGTVSVKTKAFNVQDTPAWIRERAGVNGDEMNLLSGLVVHTGSGDRELKLDEIVSYTTHDLRSRIPLYERDLKDFSPIWSTSVRQDWNEGKFNQKIIDEYGTHPEEYSLYDYDLERTPYPKARKEHARFQEYMEDGLPRAFLVQDPAKASPDHIHELVIGNVEELVLENLPVKRTYMKSIPNPKRGFMGRQLPPIRKEVTEDAGIDIVKAVKLKTLTGEVREIPIEYVRAVTQRSVRNYMGEDMRDFAGQFALPLPRGSGGEMQNSAEFKILDVLKPTAADTVERAANAPLSKKIKGIWQLSGMAREFKEAEEAKLIAAIHIGNEEIGADGTKAGLGNYTDAQIATKRRLLKEAAVPEDKIEAVMDSGWVAMPIPSE